MNAPHIILDCLPSFSPQNCQIWWKFDVVIRKIILLVFLLRHCKTNVGSSFTVNSPEIYLKTEQLIPGN